LFPEGEYLADLLSALHLLGSTPSCRIDQVEHLYVCHFTAGAPLTKEDGAMNQDTVQSKAEMLIHKPVAEVFEAFINPDITSKFWFTKGSGRLEAGKQVQWDWEMYDMSIPVTVHAIESDKRIRIEWPGYGTPTLVEWVFAPQQDGTTFVSITESGFTGTDDELLKQVVGSTEGFTLVLAGLKALLEHNIKLNLVADRFPNGLTEH
jgi:uncharacterized protein YndB with AHSA1/START domain